ncbi:MAG: cytidine deaminase [Deltaproteobacteria bacterium]|nr:cytidine deaminase [Deltaproteobacteria bacterium]
MASAKRKQGTPDLRALEDTLVEAALEARKKAYAPYSGFLVGAALLTESGEIVGGCNVENASYGLSICAERTAVARAVAQGHQHFTMVAVATQSSPPSPPCGVCLQTLAEFETDLRVVLVNPQGERARLQLTTLLPVRFQKKSLED